MDQDKIIEMICLELEDHDEPIYLVGKLDSSTALYELLDHYNWDDGFGVPLAIAEHSCCDLAIAKGLYWLATAYYWYTSDTFYVLAKQYIGHVAFLFFITPIIYTNWIISMESLSIKSSLALK